MSECPKCNNPLNGEGIAAGGKLWHPQCFRCFNCKKDLGDRLFYIKKRAVFCSGCYHSMYKQRCSACCKPVKSQGLKAMDVFWHQHCFRCLVCRAQLTQKFCMSNKKQAYCLICYQKEQDEAKQLETLLTSLPSKVLDDIQQAIYNESQGLTENLLLPPLLNSTQNGQTNNKADAPSPTTSIPQDLQKPSQITEGEVFQSPIAMKSPTATEVFQSPVAISSPTAADVFQSPIAITSPTATQSASTPAKSTDIKKDGTDVVHTQRPKKTTGTDDPPSQTDFST